MADEPIAAGGNFSAVMDTQRKGLLGRKSTTSMTGSFSMEIPGIKQTAADLTSVTDALSKLKSTLQGMSQAFSAGPVVNMLSQISRQATVTTQSLTALNGVVASAGRGGAGQGGGGGGGFSHVPPAAPSGGGSGGASLYNSLSQSAGASTTSKSVGGLGGQVGSAIANIASPLTNLPIVGGLMQFAGDMAMFPLRFTRERVNKNRSSAYSMSSELTPYQWQSGTDASSMMRSLSTIPGAMKGDVNDVLDALRIGRGVGASYGFGGASSGGRANQFYNAIGQFQQMTPGVGAGQVAQNVGQQLSNTQSNQAAAFYTGGAFSMLAQGGGMKSAGQWAEGIYKWLINQRPGRDRGKEFSHGELLAQNFPGSNINAWFQTTGVTPQMQDYWWTWALARTQMGGGVTGDKVFDKMGGEGGALTSNQSWRKAMADTEKTKSEFGLAGQMTGQYATRERSNQWYNRMMGQAVNRMLPGMVSSGPMAAIQYMPDEIEQFLWNALESSGPLGHLFGGGLGAMSMGMGLQNSLGLGDVGDVGDSSYGMMGGTGTAGLSPDMRSKVGAMMKANPRLRVTSGLRDKYTSAKLKRKGIGNFGTGTPFMGDVGDGRSVNKHSPHSAGWAADMGPRSEYGWLQKNAHKFGLQTAGGKGEPWHVQASGTMGDVGDVGDLGGLLGPLTGVAGMALGGPMGIINTAMDGIEMLGKLLQTVFNAIGTMKSMSTGGGLLDMSETGGDMTTKVGQYMDLMGLSAGKGKASDTVLGYDAGFGAGLPSSISMSGDSWKGKNYGSGVLADIIAGTQLPSLVGAVGSAGATAASVDRILQKYAGTNTVEAKSITTDVKSKMMTALQAAAATGLSGDELVAAVSLAGRESGYNPMAHNPNAGTGDNSYGLWQINMLGTMGPAIRKAIGINSNEELYDPMVNAKAMKYLFDQSSTPFQAWGPYKNQPPLHGGAEDWVPTVYSVAKEQGMVGDPGMDYQSASPTSNGRVTAIQFNNQFHINGGSGSGGLDIGRMVPIMADRLEQEMNRRLAVRR